MTEEAQKAYDEACIPYMEGGGAIGIEQTKMRSWRYFLEINSACTLRCPTCTKGNVEGYEHENGFMDWDMMEKIIDKIKAENPAAIVFMYGNSEPFVHPKLAECIAAVKSRGLRCELSTNLNFVRRLDDVFAARPDFIIISLSGFYQETYVKGHAGGDIEKVKANMKLLAEAHARAEHKTIVSVNYHVYNDNGHELELMKEYAESLGIGFFVSLARAISMENAIQYCRSKDPEATDYEIQDGRPDWNKVLPAVAKPWLETMARLRIPPDKAREMYQHVPMGKACPVGAGGMFTFIRHDGKTELCACVADRRITVGDYLDTTPEQMIEQRAGHSICQQCMKYRTNLYFHIVDREKWVP